MKLVAEELLRNIYPGSGIIGKNKRITGKNNR